MEERWRPPGASGALVTTKMFNNSKDVCDGQMGSQLHPNEQETQLTEFTPNNNQYQSQQQSSQDWNRSVRDQLRMTRRESERKMSLGKQVLSEHQSYNTEPSTAGAQRKSHRTGAAEEEQQKKSRRRRAVEQEPQNKSPEKKSA